MYYLSDKTSDLEQAQAPQSGLGIAPLIVAAGITALPAIAAMFGKKKKEKPPGPTKAQLEMMRQQAEREQKDRYIKYGLIAAGALFIGFVVYKTFKKGKS